MPLAPESPINQSKLLRKRLTAADITTQAKMINATTSGQIAGNPTPFSTIPRTMIKK